MFKGFFSASSSIEIAGVAFKAHNFPWNFQVEPESLGNDSSGDPAILVGDDGLASGPMVAVSFSACIVADGSF